MAPVHREVHDDEIVLSHDAVDGRRWLAQIAVERRERLAQAFAALRSGRMLDKVLGDQVEGGAIPTSEGLLEGHHRLRRRHRVITPETGSWVRVPIVVFFPCAVRRVCRPPRGYRSRTA